MKLLTEQMKKELPALGSTAEESNPMVVAHFFNPCGAGDWYVIEGGEVNGDYEFYGIANIIAPDFGSFRLSELESLKLPLGLTIERDLYWQPKGCQEVFKKELQKAFGG